MSITIVFKNGYSFSMTCESFTIKQDGFGQLAGLETWKRRTEHE